MKILSNPSDIEKNICDCIEKYENISISVAWASSNSEAYKLLIQDKNIKKIKFSTVGLHFYQTHPDFINNFLDDDRVKFCKQSEGIFHPKIYLFWNNQNDWVSIIGSANFTLSALTKNTEIMIMFSQLDVNDFQEVKNIIIDNYEKAEIFKKEDFQGYQNIWNQKNKQKQNLDDFKFSQKPLYKSSILSLNWEEYYSLLLKKGNSLDERLKLLKRAQEYFNQNTFLNMTEEQRKNIVGANFSKDGINDWRLFGRMPIPRFIARLNSKDSQLEYISNSIDMIPNLGKITKTDYENFLYYFKASDNNFIDSVEVYKKECWGYGISPISRLLSMKRPDEFFCLTNANQSKLLEHFGINKQINTKDYERYWNEIIEAVRESPWYNSDKPTNPKELSFWNARVAMMDSLFYNN